MHIFSMIVGRDRDMQKQLYEQDECEMDCQARQAICSPQEAKCGMTTLKNMCMLRQIPLPWSNIKNNERSIDLSS